jgi:hypothetical protein
MAKYKLEYIWLDGYEPVANLRGKTQIKEFKSFPKLEELPMWGFDGSSTRQAEARGFLSRYDPHQWRFGHVRGHDAGWQDAASQQCARDHP